MSGLDEAIPVTQFIRNKCLRLWMDTRANKNKLYTFCVALARDYPFANALNSQARQAASERAAYGISRYLKPDKSGKRLKKPQFQKNNRSVQYKATGWKLSSDRRRITFTDNLGIGTMKMMGTQDLCAYDLAQIKRVQVVKKADLFFVQFCIDVERSEPQEVTGKTLGLDMGLASFYTDSDGQKVDCPKFLRKAEKQLKREQRRLSRKKKGSKNRAKVRVRVSRRHLKVSRQRKDFADESGEVRGEVQRLRGPGRPSSQKPDQEPPPGKIHSRRLVEPVWELAPVFRQGVRQARGEGSTCLHVSQDCSSCGNRV